MAIKRREEQSGNMNLLPRRAGVNASGKKVDLVHMKQKCSSTKYILHRPEERPMQSAWQGEGNTTGCGMKKRQQRTKKI